MSLESVAKARIRAYRAQEVQKWKDSLPDSLKGYDIDAILADRNDTTFMTKSMKFLLSKYMENPTRFAVFHGPSGLGKTIIGAEVCRKFLEEGRAATALYTDSSTLLNDLSFRETDSNPIRRAITPDILFVDDVGAGSAGLTATRKTGMWAIINERWANDKYTIFTSNLSVGKDSAKGNASSIQDWFGESAWDRIASSLTRVSFRGASQRHDESDAEYEARLEREEKRSRG